MPRYEVRPATVADADYLASRLREVDVEECAARGHGPREALLKSIELSSEAWTGFADGQPICMFGVAPKTLTSDEACPWLLASVSLPRHAKAFLRANLPYMEHQRAQYRVLHNYVGSRNTVAIRWLSWLGFSVSAEETDIGGMMMRHFEAKQTEWAPRS